MGALSYYNMMQKESLGFRFNESIKYAYPKLSPVSAKTIESWFRLHFPKFGISTTQSDYCDTCAEMKQQIESIRRSSNT